MIERLERGIDALFRHWLALLNLFLAAYVGLPLSVPFWGRAGLEGVARAITLAYRPLCHQLPERSYFLWGWKVPLCHRDLALYGGLLLFGLLYGAVGGRRRWPVLSGRTFLLLTLPILVDGGSHMVNDVLRWTGAGEIRETNRWLQLLTGGRLPTWFYVGHAVGSFNWWARQVTALLFAWGAIGYLYPRLEAGMEEALGRPAARREGEIDGRTAP